MAWNRTVPEEVDSLDIIHIGIIGLTHPHSHDYLTAMLARKDVRVLGGWDDDPVRAADVLGPSELTVFDTPDALLCSEIDAVVICSENARRAEWTIAAARAGKHVLCEYPLGVSLQDASDMIRTCREAGVRLMTAFPHRYLPAVCEAKRAVERGDIGVVLALKGSCHGRTPEGEVIDPSLSGEGPMMEHSAFLMDLMRWMTNDEPDVVYAETGCSSSDGPAAQYASLIHTTFRGGQKAVLDISCWSSKASFPAPGSVTMEMIGTDGMISIDVFAQANELYCNASARAGSSYWGDHGHEGVIEDFVHMIRSDHPAPITGEDGLAVAAVARAASQSASLGIPVFVERREDDAFDGNSQSEYNA